tara:strand:- start:465 stop:3014 length:2550 start_codon:yes stop_codon:yes gene_type:complete
MTSVDVNDVLKRTQSTANGSTTDFTFSFQVNATNEIKVYEDTTLKTEGTHYDVVTSGGSAGLNDNGTGVVKFKTSPSDYTPANGKVITILSVMSLARSSIYSSGGNITAGSLETDFDRLHRIAGDFKEVKSRTLIAPEYSATDADMTLPSKADRLGKILGFNASTGNPELSASLTAVQSLADVTTAINLLGTSAVVEDLGILATTAIVEDMSLLATSSNVSAMALLGVSGVITDMGLLGTSAVVEDMGFLGTSANVTAMGHLGTSANVTAMGKLGNDATVADMAILGTDDVVADMNTLATSDIISDLNTLATSDIVTDMNLLATSANVTAMGHLGTSANVTAMGLLGTSAVVEDMGFLGTSANVTAMGNLGTSTNVTNMANLNASGVITNIANLNASGVITNIGTVASNVSGVNSFAERYRVASSAPSSSLDVGDLYFDTSANELKVYKASGWASAGSTVNGTSARFHYDISGTPTTVTGADASGNTLGYDAGFIDVYVNGVRMSAEDITVTSGTSVVFASALEDGDDVDIVAFGTFSVANIVSTGALNTGSITSGFGNIDTGSSTITTTGAISGGTLTGTLQTASQTNITGVGALNAGSITSGFGAIDNGSSAITTTGAISGGTLTGTLQTASQPNITSTGTLTSFRSTGIDDNADALTITIDSSEQVGIGTTSPSAQLHIDEASSNSYATMRLEGNNRGGQIDMYQGSTIVSQIFTDQSGNIYFGSSGGYGQVAIDSKAYMASENKAFGFRTSEFITTMADDSTKNIVTNGSGLIIVSSYTYGRCAVFKHDWVSGTTLITGDTLYYATGNTDGKYSVESNNSSFTATLRNRFGGNADFKVMFIGTYQ